MARRVIWISLGAIAILLLVAVIGSGSLLVLSSTATDTSYSFNSPSNARTIRLIETCRDNACSHQAVISQNSSGGTRQDVRCGLDIAADRPVFEDVSIDWLPDEGGVLITFGAGLEAGGQYALDFARDCNA